MTVSDSPLTCSRLGPEALAGLASEWLALLQDNPEASPFAHPVWYRTWLAHFEERNALFLTFRGPDSGLAGVVPIAVDGTSALGLGNPKIQDYTGTAAARGREQAIATALLTWAADEGIRSLSLWGIPARAPLAATLEEAADTAGWRATLEEEAVAPVANIGGGWDAFVASLSKKNRHELRRKLRNLEAAGEVQLETIAEPARVRESVESLIRMMRASHEGKTRFLTSEMEAFFLDIGPAMAAAGSGRTWNLSLDGRAAAILLGFDRNGTRFLYNSGYDPGYAHLAVGLLSKALAMKAAANDRFRRFDFLRGREEYKRRLGGVEQPILDVQLTRDI